LGAKRKLWNWNLFLEDAKERIPEHIKTLEEIYKFSEETIKGKGGLKRGTGKKYGSFKIYSNNLFDGKDIISVNSDEHLTINFAYSYQQELSDENSKKIAEIVDKFAEQLYNAGLPREISHENYKEAGKQYPTIRTAQWANKINELKEILKELISSMENSTAANIQQ